MGLLLAALGATLTLTACESGSSPVEDATTQALQDSLAAVPGVADSRVRHYPGDNEYVSISLDLLPGTHALATAPVIDATRDAVEGSEYRDVELMLTLRWRDDDHDLDMTSHGTAPVLGALANEVHAMAVLEQHGFERTVLTVSDTAVDARYRRTIDVTLPAGAPGRALNRVREALVTQLPDTQQETTLDVRYYGEYDDDGPTDSRSLSVPADAPAELVELADAYLRDPVPPGWPGATDVYVNVDGYGTELDDWYVSVDTTLAPLALWDVAEADLEDHLGSDVVMDAGHHAARAAALPGVGAFVDVRLESRDGYADVAGFYSGDCREAWDDRSGRSRELWRTWVESGGEPTEDGATATECPGT
nr:hypothetical protein DA06_06520 [Georgenia sp. SUBG003]